jgi:dTDP-4-amino-4,6-dideoxygalactose transaminase
MTELQVALGVSQIERLNYYVARRPAISRRYDQLLAEDQQRYVVATLAGAIQEDCRHSRTRSAESASLARTLNGFVESPGSPGLFRRRFRVDVLTR